MYLTFEVHGNYVSEIKSEIKIPEVWKREFYGWTPYNTVRMFCVLGIFFALLMIGIRYLLKLINEKKPNWTLALSFGVIVSILWLLEFINWSDRLIFYNTSKPINIFLFQKYIGGTLGSLFFGICAFIVTLIINLAWTNFFTAFKKENRKIYLQDAFVSMLCSIGLILIISTIYG